MRLHYLVCVPLWVVSAATAAAAGVPFFTASASCATIDPRALGGGDAYCHVRNISQAECTRVAGQAGIRFYDWQDLPIVGGSDCALLPENKPSSATGGSVTPRRLASIPQRPVPAAEASRLGGAAANLGMLGGILGQVDTVAGAWASLFGRNLDRDGVASPGGLAFASAEAMAAAAIQYLLNGIAFELASDPDDAESSYQSAYAAATEAGDDALAAEIRQQQFELHCRNAITAILATGQNPEDRLTRLRALQGNCGQGTSAALIASLIDLQIENLPPESNRSKDDPVQSGGRLRNELLDELRRLLSRDEQQRAALSNATDTPVSLYPPTPPASDAGPQTNGNGGQETPTDRDLALAEARSQQASKRRIYCGQSSDPGNCLSNASFCIGQFSADRQKFQQCQVAFHDPNLWYESMKDFSLDPVKTQSKIDGLLGTFNAKFGN